MAWCAAGVGGAQRNDGGGEQEDARGEQGAVEARVSASGRRRVRGEQMVVREVAMAEKIAIPSAPPTCCEVLSSAAASPALSGARRRWRRW